MGITISNLQGTDPPEPKRWQFSTPPAVKLKLVAILSLHHRDYGWRQSVRNHTRVVWDPKYEVAYHVVWLMGGQLKLIDKSGRTCKVNVQDVKVTYLVNELIKCLPDDKAFGHATKYCAHPKHLEGLCWSLNQNVLPDI